MVVFHHQARRAARLFGQASLWVLAASAAWAADPAPNPAPDPVSGGMLEEIVVTAQKRSESLQDTPISITAFTAASMDRMNITNIQQIGTITPNLMFDFTAPVSGASNAATVFIRGVGQSDFAMTTEAGVGPYVDGIYMSRSIGGVLDVLDIERVEVLRGPQGTLFGRNTIGGAINITTIAPNDEFGGLVDASVGNYGRLHLRSSVN